jgi:hypothetical protein
MGEVRDNASGGGGEGWGWGRRNTASSPLITNAIGEYCSGKQKLLNVRLVGNA